MKDMISCLTCLNHKVGLSLQIKNDGKNDQLTKFPRSEQRFRKYMKDIEYRNGKNLLRVHTSGYGS